MRAEKDMTISMDAIDASPKGRNASMPASPAENRFEKNADQIHAQ